MGSALETFASSPRKAHAVAFGAGGIASLSTDAAELVHEQGSPRAGSTGKSQMMASHFPCRACGLPTEGVDIYVICADCALDFEGRVEGQVEGSRRDGADHLAPITGETEARLRRLLDDW